jgi:hypothetical protein
MKVKPRFNVVKNVRVNQKKQQLFKEEMYRELFGVSFPDFEVTSLVKALTGGPNN